MKFIAPAKLNLYLHITGRRHDGYHLIESVFVFTEFGDEITITPADTLSLTIDGPFQSVLSGENLILRAAKGLQEKFSVVKGAQIHLTKNIPVGAGLGGGSSDAAAVLKALNQFWQVNCDEKTLMAIGLKLGADIPACIAGHPAFVSGIGEHITPITLNNIPSIVLLVNPKRALSTLSVFRQYQPCFTEAKNHAGAILENHNDLEKPAISLMPDIQVILTALGQQPDCALARMSGSGATCFALFETYKQAQYAEQVMKKHFPDYWVMLTKLTM